MSYPLVRPRKSAKLTRKELALLPNVIDRINDNLVTPITEGEDRMLLRMLHLRGTARTRSVRKSIGTPTRPLSPPIPRCKI